MQTSLISMMHEILSVLTRTMRTRNSSWGRRKCVETPRRRCSISTSHSHSGRNTKSMVNRSTNTSSGSKGEHIAKLAIFKNNRLTIGEQKNAIQNFYNLLLTEFRLMDKVGNPCTRKNIWLSNAATCRSISCFMPPPSLRFLEPLLLLLDPANRNKRWPSSMLH